MFQANLSYMHRREQLRDYVRETEQTHSGEVPKRSIYNHLLLLVTLPLTLMVTLGRLSAYPLHRLQH